MNRPVIIVHGGADAYGADCRPAYVAGCRRAAEVGWAILRAGGSALDAVEAAVRSMEDDPTFDAGRGSYFNRAGEVEMDAIIMDGRALTFGAVAAVRRIPNPVTLARAVLERSEHNFLVAHGAEAFAESIGLPFAAPDEVLGKHEDPEVTAIKGGDTVGAVALDEGGALAVATSTGGIANKWPGRVGDSPLVGCGAYADDRSGAASATGVGEMLMRIVVSKAACDFIAAGMTAQQAAEAVIRLLEERVGGKGGIIVIDRLGRVGLAHNTCDMAYAYVTAESGLVAGPEAGQVTPE